MASAIDWLAFLSCIQKLQQHMTITVKQKPFDLKIPIPISIPDLLPFQIPEIIQLPDFLNNLPEPPNIPVIPGIELEVPIPWPINIQIEPKVVLPVLPQLPAPSFQCPI